DNKPDPFMYIPVAQVKRWSDGAEQQHHSHHLGDPHQGRALLAEQRNSRRATHGERRVARCAYPIDGTSEGRIHCAHGLQYDAVDDFRGRRTAAGRDWYLDRKSTRLNSSHVAISYAVFCLKKKKKNN